MKMQLRISLIMLFFGLFSTASYSQIKSDYDKDVDFSKYKTYTFAGWEKGSDQILNDFDKERIVNAMKEELDSRGLKHVESGGDASITFFVVVDQKTSTTAYTDYTGGVGYRGRWGWGMGPGMASSTTTYSESDYLEGTFVVDFFDGASKDLAWQGVITTTVKEKPEKREKSIPKNIGKLMKKFPVDPVK